MAAGGIAGAACPGVSDVTRVAGVDAVERAVGDAPLVVDPPVPGGRAGAVEGASRRSRRRELNQARARAVRSAWAE